MFTAPYSVFRGGLYAPKSTVIKGWDDIKGMRVGVNRGSSIEGELTSREKALNLDIVLFEDNATGIQALFSGQLDAWLDADSIAGPALKARPDANIEAKFFFLNQPNSMTVRKDAFELHQWLNNFIYFIRNSGELSAISEKWLGSPLPADLPVF
jgi:polar amino acid transport system substrate-binding protein